MRRQAQIARKIESCYRRAMNDNPRTPKEHALASAHDLAGRYLWDDRKDDEDLPRGVIEGLVNKGELTVDEIVAEFRAALEEGL